MNQEIATIPDVIAGQLADPGGHVRELAGLARRARHRAPVPDRLRRLGVRRTGRDPGLPAAQPAARARRARAGPGPLRRPLPAGGQRRAGHLLLREGRPHDRGRRAGGRVRRPGHRAHRPGRRPAGRGGRPHPAHRGAHARLLPRHQHLYRDAVHAHRAGPADPAGFRGRRRRGAAGRVRAARGPSGQDPRRVPRGGRRPGGPDDDLGPVRDVPRRRAERGHGPVRRREALRGVPAGRAGHQRRGVGARGILHHPARRSGHRRRPGGRRPGPGLGDPVRAGVHRGRRHRRLRPGAARAGPATCGWPPARPRSSARSWPPCRWPSSASTWPGWPASAATTSPASRPGTSTTRPSTAPPSEIQHDGQAAARGHHCGGRAGPGRVRGPPGQREADRRAGRGAARAPGHAAGAAPVLRRHRHRDRPQGGQGGQGGADRARVRAERTVQRAARRPADALLRHRERTPARRVRGHLRHVPHAGPVRPAHPAAGHAEPGRPGADQAADRRDQHQGPGRRGPAAAQPPARPGRRGRPGRGVAGPVVLRSPPPTGAGTPR